jgi:hypothetical protein
MNTSDSLSSEASFCEYGGQAQAPGMGLAAQDERLSYGQ